MKLQHVILRAIAKRISWGDAAEIAGLNVRTMGSILRRYEQFGYDGLYDQTRRKRHFHRVPLPMAERVLALYQEAYAGWGALPFWRALRAEHGIELSYSWLCQALEGAGLVPPSHKRGPARPRRRPVRSR